MPIRDQIASRRETLPERVLGAAAVDTLQVDVLLRSSASRVNATLQRATTGSALSPASISRIR